MKDCPSPSPSKIVMTAILELKQDRGTSLGDIVKYAKTKYGLSGDVLRNRISAALKRGIKYKILYLDGGLYRVNESLCNSSPEEGNLDERRRDENGDEEVRQTKAKKSKSKHGSLIELSESSLKERRSRQQKVKERKSFLCPECQESIKADAKETVKGEDGKNRGRYQLRPRKTPSGSSDKVSSGPRNQKAKGEEKKNEGKVPWRDFLKMGISFRNRRRNKDKKK